ncbi:hypothetical protein COL26b_005292 [Colletotrichum chrysophilum]|uniref:uncharacterized protein n=1 Tax=Colletotrichum chrysophilum TaxID=1836956 RepID=UPI00230050FD|nr:uncharacterized protein COL26b_005292 [Colletotrichum chrysophilum]KAJ0349950.1 hypothetical protein KNSL1_004332 [Colletotrichum chrysophilum]KAJ0376478.1 hypothetical protein COL26b_005292 [Colletotrichum chrysophilum]
MCDDFYYQNPTSPIKASDDTDNVKNSYLQDRSSMEGTVQPKLAYPECPLVKSDDAVDQGHAVSDSAASPSPIAYQDQGSNTAGDNTIDEDDRALYQLLRYHVNSEISSTSSDPQPTGSVPTPFTYPVVGASVPSYIAGNNNTSQPGVFASPSANSASSGTHGYFHSTGSTNAAPSNNLTLNAPVATMTTAPTGTASVNMNAVSINTALANAPPVNAAPVNAAPANTVAYQGHPIYSRRRRHRIGTRGCHVGSSGIDRPNPPEPLPIPGPPAGAPPGVTYPLSRMAYRPPAAPFHTSSGQKRFPCNRCGLVRSREDETRFHLRDVHYRQEYKWIHYGNHEEGLYYFGIDQSNIDCPSI